MELNFNGSGTVCCIRPGSPSNETSGLAQAFRQNWKGHPLVQLWQWIIAPCVLIIMVGTVAVLVGIKALDETTGEQRPDILRALADLVRAIRGRR